jgi:acyl-coenzyme A thioesterase PaaI-like protein
VTQRSEPPHESSPSATISEYQAIVSRGLSGALGIEVVEVSAERVVATMPVNERSTQVWTIEIRDETERLVCLARCTMAVVAIDPPVG